MRSWWSSWWTQGVFSHWQWFAQWTKPDWIFSHHLELHCWPVPPAFECHQKHPSGPSKKSKPLCTSSFLCCSWCSTIGPQWAGNHTAKCPHCKYLQSSPWICYQTQLVSISWTGVRRYGPIHCWICSFHHSLQDCTVTMNAVVQSRWATPNN